MFRKLVPLILFLSAAVTFLTGGYIAHQQKQCALSILLTKQNLHTIQLALELYDVKHDAYPRTLDDPGMAVALHGSSIVQFPPINPFTDQPMKEISFQNRHVAGDYTYIRIPPGEYNGKHTMADSYYLLAYGPRKKSSLDVDADGNTDSVLLILDSTSEVVWDVPAIRANGGVVEQATEDKAYRSPPMSLSDALRLAD